MAIGRIVPQRTQIMAAKIGPLFGDVEPIVLKIGCNYSVAYRYALFSSKTACVSAYMVSTAFKTWNWQRMCFASVKCCCKAEISAQSLSVIVTLVTETSLFYHMRKWLPPSLPLGKTTLLVVQSHCCLL